MIRDFLKTTFNQMLKIIPTKVSMETFTYWTWATSFETTLNDQRLLKITFDQKPNVIETKVSKGDFYLVDMG